MSKYNYIRHATLLTFASGWLFAIATYLTIVNYGG